MRLAVRQAAMAASMGNSRSRATTDQFERITTTVDPHPNLPNHLLPRRRRSFAEALAPAAASAPLRRPRPVGHGRRFAGFWRDRRRLAPKDSIASSQFFPGTHMRSKGILVTL
jgi:hypothetical protein